MIEIRKKKIRIICGVLQECVLGPLLFELIRNASHLILITLLVDDTDIFTQGIGKMKCELCCYQN